MKKIFQDVELVLSVIVLNFNGLKFLKTCLDSLYEFIDVPFEIIFVDNQSSDESADFVASNYSGVKVVISPENGGFSKGNNLGVSEASGQYLLILNNDTILQSPVSGGITILDEVSSVGVVGAKMLSSTGAYRQSACNFPGIVGAMLFAKNFVSNAPFDSGDFNTCAEEYHIVDWVEASFSIVRRSDFLNIGGYNENHFMYAEDMDFCYRMRLQGLHTVYFPQAQYVHFGGFNSTRYEMLVEGYSDFFRDNYKPLHGFLCNTALFFGLAIKVLACHISYLFRQEGNIKIKLASYSKALKMVRWT
jgi:GT2 family glycosyltransferase